jgi:hypothetical protein
VYFAQAELGRRPLRDDIPEALYRHPHGEHFQQKCPGMVKERGSGRTLLTATHTMPFVGQPVQVVP